MYFCTLIKERIMKRIQLIEVNSEIAAGTRGTSLGIAAMKVASLNKGSNLFSKYSTIEVENENQLLFQEVTTPFAKRIDGVVNVYHRVCDQVKTTLKNEQYPVILAGDHSTAGGTIAGIRSAFPGKKLGVIWIDAHADLHTPYTSPSGNIHGMPLGASLGTNNEESQVNKIDDHTKNQWEALKNVGNILPKIEASDLFFIGVRDTEQPEDDLMNRNSIRNVTVVELREKGVQSILAESKEYFKDTNLIYVSFDVDSMDASLSKGTGTPVDNGLSKEEATELMEGFIQEDKVKCFEIVEVNPCLDDKVNTMAENAFDILETSIKQLENKLGE